MTRIELDDEAATARLGAMLAPTFLAAGGGVLFLQGDLGAGKTTLARGFLRAAGVTGVMRSPTYTLMEPYQAAGQRLLHLDLYRLVDAGEVEFLGLRDESPDSVIWLVEWPERGQGHLPAADLSVHLLYRGSSRVAECHARGTRMTFDIK